MRLHFIQNVKNIIKSMGIVFGDIGTSPIYTLSALVILFVNPTQSDVLGFISLIIWTLVTLVFIEYVWLAMNLGKKGEGGTIVLREILLPLVKSKKQKIFISIFSFIGISLFIGDGVITPAVSILSAVEGLPLIPALQNISQNTLVILACIIAIFLFLMQKKGTEKVGSAFGPFMLLWFIVLGASGIASIIATPAILQSINPYYAIHFIITHKLASLSTLATVILCATGAEALYADMGHLGKKPILRAWYFVFVILIISYMGQGAFFIRNPDSTRILYEMFLNQAPFFYSAFVILSLIATVIASQGLISGIFSVVYQGMSIGILPRLKIDFTSSKLRSQIFIPSINFMLSILVILMIVSFKNYISLVSVYGLGVTGSMMFTGIMMTWIFYKKNLKIKMLIALGVTFLDLIFFISGLTKIPHGAYWSIIIALLPFSILIIYTKGQKKLRQSLAPTPLEDFVPRYKKAQKEVTKLDGTAIFFIRDIRFIPPFISQTLLSNNIFYEDNILVSVITRDGPFGGISFFKGSLAPGLRIFEIHRGYMEILDIEQILKDADIDEKVMFYGLDDIVTKNIFWRIYANIKRLVPSFVEFYKLPSNKTHGVGTLVKL